jgi:hypothetical protein
MIRSATYYIAVTSLAACGLAFAQDPQDSPAPPDQAQAQQQIPVPPPPSDQQMPAPNGNWRRASDPPQAPPAQPTFAQRPNYAAYPNYGPQGQIQGQPQGQGPNGPPAPPPVPAQLTIKQGTYVTVRVNQPLSSDRNHPGDAFTATLVRPIVVDGVIVAPRGQTIGGVVKEAQKAGRVEGVSHLGVQLTDLTLVDGQQVPIQSQLITWKGDTSVGRDVAGVGATTAAGAAIGAGVNGGVGAGVGAGAGLIVGTIGVLLTRGRPTIIYPEAVLTFRVEAPVTIATDRAPYAFRYVDPNEYDRPNNGGPQLGYRPPPSAPYYGYGYPYAYGYPYYPYPYWGGVGFGFYPGFYYGRGFYGRGFYGGGYRGFRR